MAKSSRYLNSGCQALHHAHNRKIIHRDVKPSNILINEEGEPLLSDFGVAKILDTTTQKDLTGTNVGIGTPYYMAPEQGRGQEVGPKTDIYSLGVVLYEMVTGRKPYEADTPLAVLLKHIEDPIPNPSKVVRGLPQHLERVILKALSKNPANRFGNVLELVSALDRGSTKRQSVTLRTSAPLIVTGGVLFLALLIWVGYSRTRAGGKLSATQPSVILTEQPLSFSPQATASSPAAFEASRFVRICEDPQRDNIYVVALRESPGLSAPKLDVSDVGGVRCGEYVEVSNNSSLADGIRWWWVSWDGFSGWMAERTISGDVILPLDQTGNAGLLAEASSWPLVFMEQFNDNGARWVPDFPGQSEGGRWTTDIDNQFWKAKISIDGSYILRINDTQGRIIYLDYPIGEKPVEDFFVSVRVRLLDGDIEKDSYGLFYRCQDFGRKICGSGPSSFYYLEITEDQYFKVSYHSPGTSGEKLIDWQHSSSINSGAWNQIGIIAINNHYYFLINDEIVGDLMENRLSGGILGIRIELPPSESKATFEFDDFAIRAP